MDKEIFVKYFNGSISAIEEKALVDWIAESKSNKAIFLKERKLWDLVNLNIPQSLLVENHQENKVYEHNNKTLWYYQALKIAAIFILVFILNVIFTKTLLHDKIGWHTIEVPIGQRTCLHLSDGTTVWLNAKSKFSFPEKFEGKTREVRLNGEGIFEVKHNDKKPFIVKTEKFDVKDLGTEFNIYAYSNSNIFEATLVKGSIALENGHNMHKTIFLKPNQRATYEQNSQTLKIENVDTKESLFWKDGIYSFNDQPLGSIIQRLERYYEVSIHVKENQILNQRFTGKFRYSDPIEIILEVIRKNTPFHFLKRGNNIIISK